MKNNYCYIKNNYKPDIAEIIGQMADDEYIYDDRTGEFKKRAGSTGSNSTNKGTNNPLPHQPNNNDDGCLGCIGGLIVLILEYWLPILIVVAFVSMCSK